MCSIGEHSSGTLGHLCRYKSNRASSGRDTHQGFICRGLWNVCTFPVQHCMHSLFCDNFLYSLHICFIPSSQAEQPSSIPQPTTHESLSLSRKIAATCFKLVCWLPTGNVEIKQCFEGQNFLKLLLRASCLFMSNIRYRNILTVNYC